MPEHGDRRLPVRLTEDCWRDLSAACVKAGVTKTAFVQALIEVSLEKLATHPPDWPARSPTVGRAREIDAQRRDRTSSL